MLSESRLERKCMVYAKKHRCFEMKNHPFTLRGVPDRLILTPTGQYIWVEFKSPDGKGKLSPRQEALIALLRSKKAEVWVIDDFQTFTIQLHGKLHAIT